MTEEGSYCIPHEVSCYAPLGSPPCQCGYGDGNTLFIKKLDVTWADASLLLTFQDDAKRLPERVTEKFEFSITLDVILDSYINMAADKSGTEIMEFWTDGKNVGLEGAQNLLATRNHVRHGGFVRGWRERESVRCGNRVT